jgi:CBS-domain-containing membrane protein
MKKIIVLFVAVATMFAQDAMAQQKPQMTEEQRAASKARREQVMQTRLQMLQEELNLTEAQYAKFEPIYRAYLKEVLRVSNRDARVKKEELTNENALKVISARLANQITNATVKQRYLLIFAEVIEPLQIEKLYRVDHRIAREAHKIVKYAGVQPQAAK